MIRTGQEDTGNFMCFTCRGKPFKPSSLINNNWCWKFTWSNIVRGPTLSCIHPLDFISAYYSRYKQKPYI